MTEYNRSAATSIVLLTTAISIFFNEAAAISVAVLINDSTSISCFTNAPIDVQWLHTPLKRPSTHVYAGGQFYWPYKGRFKLDNPKQGVYILIIPETIPDDAGLYECGEDQTAARFGLTNLTVLDSDPLCTSNMRPDGFVGQNNCNLQQENMTFTCGVSYTGNNAPLLTLRLLNTSHAHSDSVCRFQPKQTSCSLTLTADLSLDGSVLICETTGSQYNCTSEVIKVQYIFPEFDDAERMIHDNLSCEVRSNLDIRHTWTLKQNGENIFLSTEKSIVAQNPGIHRCEVKYSIRNITCFTLVSSVNISVIQAVIYSATGNHLTGIIVPVVIILVLAVVFVAAVAVRRKRRRTSNSRETSLRMSENDNCIAEKIADLFRGISNSNTLLILEEVKQKIGYPATNNEDSPSSPSSKSGDIERLIKTASEKVLRGHGDFLLDRMSPDFGLIDELYSNHTLSKRQKKEIEESVIPERNRILLKHIVAENAYKELCEALKKCDQSHLVNYMGKDGVYEPQFGGNWPLTEKKTAILLENHTTLIDELNSRVLVSLLYATGALNKRQKNLISSRTSTKEENKVLIEILRKGSLDCYWKTIQCLNQSNQSHIAEILEPASAVVRIDANLQPRNSNLTNIENSIAEEIIKLLIQPSASDRSRLLAKVQLSLVDVAVAH